MGKIITVVGEFSSGKSTFINALIGVDLLPVSVKPTTATINTISYSEDKKVTLQFWGPIDEETGKETKEGGTKEIDIMDLKSHTTSLTDEADEISKKTKIVKIFYPTEYCKNSVTIVDTPGFNSVHASHIYFNYLMNGNAIIWLLNPLQTLSGSEREYLRKAKHYISKILFVVPKMDLVDEDDRADVWDIFKSDIPKETNTTDEVNLYPINALLAANGDWETSGLTAIQRRIEELLNLK